VESGDTGINLFTNGVTTRTRGVDVMFDLASDFEAVDITWSVAATYTETEVTKVRDTPPELGTTQSLFDIVALGDLTETAPKYLVNLGARMEWSRLSLSVHELVYGPASQWENDGGATDGYFDGTPPPPSNLPDPTPGGLRFYKPEIPATPITNLELSWEAMDNLSVIVGATNVFDEKP